VGQACSSRQSTDDDGTVVGTVYFADHADPYVWPRHGRPYALHGPAGTSWPDASVIRHGWVGGSVNDPLTKPVRWDPHTRRAQRVGLDSGWVTAINSRGTVAAGNAIAHRDGRVVALPGLLSDRWYAANTLADNGTAAGGATGPDGRHAVVWRGC
jgi:hypothetical protein